jgi:hypothetical protein
LAPSSRKSLALALVSDGGIKAVFGIIENLDVIFSKIVFDSDVCGVFFVFRQKKILFQSFTRSYTVRSPGRGGGFLSKNIVWCVVEYSSRILSSLIMVLNVCSLSLSLSLSRMFVVFCVYCGNNLNYFCHI